MSSTDALGDRMKSYERSGEGDRLNVALPVYARLDGRSFSKFTRDMNRPFDVRFSVAMIATMNDLVDKTHARIGYTQSDEISLLYKAETAESDILFNGRTQKLASVLASLAAAIFATVLTGYASRLPHFDCRVCQLPNEDEAANMILWRWKDATKNAIQMVAQANFSTKQLHGKNGTEMVQMLRECGIEFDALPAFFRRGTFAQRISVFRELTEAELSKIPARHRPISPVERHAIRNFEIEDFFSQDRVATVFGYRAKTISQSNEHENVPAHA